MARGLARQFLRAPLRWKPISEPREGYTIILGVPWDLRHLLELNLRFIESCDLISLEEIIIVFDRRPRPGGAELIERTLSRFGDLPMRFVFHGPIEGRVASLLHSAAFYHCTNTVLALARCRTRHAILHDFDLYPVVSGYFECVYAAMVDRSLRFTGLELTTFSGLRREDRVLGTWCLGIDAAWLRENFAPVDCFIRMGRVGDRRIRLDLTSYLQLRTPQRDLVKTIGREACCHANNLCSTYLQWIDGRPLRPVWRLHQLWYFEELSGAEDRMRSVTSVMEAADSSFLTVDDRAIDFADTHVTCANVLRDELERMDTALFGSMRSSTTEFVDAFARFLSRFGDSGRLDEDPPAMKTAV